MLKKLYILPNTAVVTISTNDMLVVFGCSQPREKDSGSDVECPFNCLCCVKKQQRLDEWRNAVQTYSKERSNRTFYTRGDMFAGCPYDYEKLCRHHMQRQFD